MNVTILLVDDHEVMRQGLRALLEKQPGMEVIGEAVDGRMAVRLAGELHPQVVIMDVAMRDMNGMEATRQIVAGARDARVIALSMHSDQEFVMGMFKAGASGYLPKDCAFAELSAAIREVASGRSYVEPRIAGVVIKECVRRASKPDSSPSSILTAREREVLQLLAEGKSTKQVAGQLSLSAKTVETHRRQTMEKLGIHSVAGLTKYAIRTGLTSLGV